jgi:hypothetical protein
VPSGSLRREGYLHAVHGPTRTPFWMLKPVGRPANGNERVRNPKCVLYELVELVAVFQRIDRVHVLEEC